MKRVVLLLMVITVLFMLVGCSTLIDSTLAETSSYEQGAKATEESTKTIIANDDLPKLVTSLDRENIKDRIEFLNQPDRIGYLYLISQNGQLIREVQVKGKVTSLNSYLTPMEQIEWFSGIDLGESYGSVPIVLQAPDLDGTYGENADGVFWFDSDGIYQEWNGLYFYSAERLTFTIQPLLIETISEEKTYE